MKGRKPACAGLTAPLPVELLNYLFCGCPLDVGIPRTLRSGRVLRKQWFVLHLPGLLLTTRLDPYWKSSQVDRWICFVSGFIDTALVLMILLLAFQILVRAVHTPKLPSD